MNAARVVFMGTPDFAVPVFEMLCEHTNVLLAVSQPDKCVGRHHELKKTPIHEAAIKYSVPVFQPTKVREEYQKIVDLHPDIIVTCAYGQIIPEEILNCATYGCINVHASLLPKLRGGAPIHHAIIDGLEETGVTIMYMDKKMDTGDIISSVSCPIYESDTVGILHDRLSTLGTTLLLETLPSILNGTASRKKQVEEEVTYGWNISREEEHLNFNASAKEIYNRVRGLYPWPTAYTKIDGIEVKVLECVIGEKDSLLSPGTIVDITKDSFGICTKDKVIYLKKVKQAGKKEMDIRDYINGLNKEKIINSIVE